MPAIKPSRFKKLPKVIQLFISSRRHQNRSIELSDKAHQHVREVQAIQANKPRYAGIPASDAKKFLIDTNRAEFQRSKATQKKAALRQKVALTRKGKLKAVQDQRIEKRRQKALIKERKIVKTMDY